MKYNFFFFFVLQPMNYSSSSPGNYGGPPGSTGPPGPGTPIMPSPQDSSNSGGENMYTMMKPVPGGNMPGVSNFYIILICCEIINNYFIIK